MICDNPKCHNWLALACSLKSTRSLHAWPNVTFRTVFAVPYQACTAALGSSQALPQAWTSWRCRAPTAGAPSPPRCWTWATCPPPTWTWQTGPSLTRWHKVQMWNGNKPMCVLLLLFITFLYLFFRLSLQIFEQVLSELEPLCLAEQDFISKFFKLQQHQTVMPPLAQVHVE